MQKMELCLHMIKLLKMVSTVKILECIKVKELLNYIFVLIFTGNERREKKGNQVLNCSLKRAPTKAPP